MAEVLNIGSSKTFTYEGCLPYRTDGGTWGKMVDTGLFIDFIVSAEDKGDTVDIAIDTRSRILYDGTGSSTFTGPGAHLVINALASNDFSYGSIRGYLFGENSATIKANNPYNRTFKVTVDKDTAPYDVELILYYQPAYKGYLQSDTGADAEKKGVNATHFFLDLTIPVKERKLTLIKGTGVKTFECVNTTNSKYNSCSGNTYYYTYGTKASTNTIADIGYLLSSHSGTNANGVGESTWTGCNGTTEYSIPEDWSMTADRTITANATPITYTIKYNSNAINTSGSTSSSSHTYNVATTLTKNGFTKTGYTFHHWNTQSNDSGTSYSDQASVKNLTTTNGDIVNLYALWSPIKYKVTYNANGGTGTTSQSEHTYDMEKNLTANRFTKTGYTFVGWNTESDGTGTPYADEDSVKNLTTTNNAIVNLYAVWQPNKVHLVYHSAGGVCVGDSPTWKEGGLEHHDVILLTECVTADDIDIEIPIHSDESNDNINIIRTGYTKQHDSGWDVYENEKSPWDTEDVNYILGSGIYTDYFELCDALGVSCDEQETTLHLYIPWAPIIYGINIEDYGMIYYHFSNSKIQSDGKESFFYKDENLQTPIYELPVPSIDGRKFIYYCLLDDDGNFTDPLTDENGALDENVYMYEGDLHAKIWWEYLASMYAKSGDSHKHGLVYIRMADGTYKMGAGVYVKVDGDWKISTK